MIKLSDILKELYVRPEAKITSDDEVKPDTDYDRERNQFGSENIQEEDPCWRGYKQYGMKDKDGKQVPNCVPVDENELNEGEYCPECMIEVLKGVHQNQLGEAEYHGRKVSLGKIMRGDVKKYKVFVRDPKSGNIKKVNFGHGGTSAKRRGEKTMRIKKSIPARRKSFRARHHCENPGPRTKARYWACRTW